MNQTQSKSCAEKIQGNQKIYRGKIHRRIDEKKPILKN